MEKKTRNALVREIYFRRKEKELRRLRIKRKKQRRLEVEGREKKSRKVAGKEEMKKRKALVTDAVWKEGEEA